ncbi:helix-turn-helix domain-containing protein [Mucilaginibacter paludis]|uniref:Transcriptional regulator, AraC family n=1 Tax=Mucilaginibacter paludis DSM 18603 TaxID=714943 RepID=H1Y0T3_9SPHI|nr:helix-turn-helix domain-containing protein [Mucilaginibacter paludis]EHQ28823.1 transcriptional regulator, AraC family [Mucilaginibacter paludis DSM 18603]
MKDIPLHQLSDRTSSGLQLKHFRIGDLPEDKADELGAHRDDHYIFFLLEKGSASMMIDFEQVNLHQGVLYYVLPAQVHHRIRNEVAAGWFIAVDTSLIPPACRNIFESGLLLQQPHLLDDAQLRQFQNLLLLLHEKCDEDAADPFHIPVIHALLQSFILMAAGCFNDNIAAGGNVSRPAELSRNFKKLLVAQLRSNKSPSAYAASLNVSESYLNESLKKITGLPVSYWIQQEIMMEAKRLLYYSQLNVKQIAHQLGYADHSYFSRFFRKTVGVTALQFREQYRK